MREIRQFAFRILKFAAIAMAAFLYAAHSVGQTRPSVRDVTALTDVVNAVQFSPDGRALAIARGARDDNRVELWDTDSGRLLRTIKGFDGAIWSVAFSPDGRVLVTGSGGMHKEKVSEKTTRHGGTPFTELKWWDWQSGELQRRWESPDSDLLSIAASYSPDGHVLAMSESRMSRQAVGRRWEDEPAPPWALFRGLLLLESAQKLIDAQTGELRRKLKGGATAVPMFRDLWGNEISPLAVARSFPNAPIFSSDGQYVAAWGPSEVLVWSSSTGAEVLKIKKFKGRLSAAAFSPDGHLLAGAIVKSTIKDQRLESSSEIRIWQIPGGAPQQVIPLMMPSVSSLVFAANGQQLLIGGLQIGEANHSYASMELADLRSGSLGQLVAREEGNASSLHLSPNGDLIAFQVDASTVRLVETNKWRTRYTLGTDRETSQNSSLRRFLITVKTVPAVAFLSDGKTVAGEIEDGEIKLWDARTGEVKRTIAPAGDSDTVAAISANGATIAQLLDEGMLRIWTLETTGRSNISLRDEKTVAAALSGDGRILALAHPHEIALLNAIDSKSIGRIDAANASLVALSFDGERLAAASASNVKIWSTKDGQFRQTFEGASQVSALGFGPQNSVLAIGRKDGSVSLYNVESGAEIFEARKHNATVNAIAFSRDGTMIASGGDDRSAIVWTVATGKPRRSLKGHDLAITSLAFSPDGATLAVGTGNASVVLWQLANGRLDRVLK